jgi:RNA polymerase sigma-70 factor (ECF subfamily)
MSTDESRAISWNRDPDPSSKRVMGHGVSGVPCVAAAAQMEDLRCVAAVRQGRSEAFTEVVRRYQDRLYNTILRLAGHRDDANDLTQQTFLRAYASIDSFRGDSSFYTWLYRIAVNVTLDARKRRVRGAAATMESLSTGRDGGLPGGAEPSSSVEDDPLERVLAREREESVARAIDSLDDLHRSVLVLRDIEGMDYDEISGVLDVPSGTVKSRLHRARLELRDRLRNLMS